MTNGDAPGGVLGSRTRHRAETTRYRPDVDGLCDSERKKRDNDGTDECPTDDLPVTTNDNITKRTRKRQRNRKQTKPKPIVGQGATHVMLPIGEPSSQHHDAVDSGGSQRGGTIEPRVDEGHLPSPLVNSTSPTTGDGGNLGRKKRGVQIIDDDGRITDELIIQDNGRLTSTRTDIPIIPAPDDGDVTDWMRDVFGQIENVR